MNDFLTLNEIKDKATNETISLPTVQRGFVWKPYQIENLWDSLLRGYPIGSFVLSKKMDSKIKQYDLLDGQQRATAICLGFYNPLNENYNSSDKIFKTSNEKIMIFIDLAKPSTESDNRKYLFRVITTSHPWGYRKNENQKVLESKDISNAMSSYQIENYDYLKKPLKEFWPYDSYEPIPLGLFINATSIADLKKLIVEWKSKLIENANENLDVLKRRKEENIKFYSIEEIYQDVRKMMEIQKIPLLQLNLSELYRDDEKIDYQFPISNKETYNSEESDEGLDVKDQEKSDIEQDKIEDRNIDEIENLFIRLNSGGTPLRGEELNYSILKSHIKSPKMLDNIENKCIGLFYPARFITIIFRLFSNQEQNRISENESISMKIKPKQFQRIMTDNKFDKSKKDDFIKYLECFLSNNTIEKIKRMLLYSETNKIGLPSFIAYSISDKSPEIMFMLLYRIYIKDDIITEELKPKVLGMITLFMWLGKGQKQRDHAKLLENIWPCIKNFDTKTFWSKETVQRAMLKDREFEILTEFPNLRNLKNIIPKGQRITELTKGKIINTYYGNFIDKMFKNKELILYAQRDALFRWFHEIAECDLEDTNRAFDWDHICPNNYVSGKQQIRPALKNWYSSNGNFRAWPYSLNRGDQTNPPSLKLNPPKTELLWWSERLNNRTVYGTEIQLRDDLLRMSACDKEWLLLDRNTEHNIKDDRTAKQVIYNILNRNISICKEWYLQLEISELIPESPKKLGIKMLFKSVIDNKKWSPKDEEDADKDSYKLPLGENNLNLYFTFNKEKNTFEKGTVFFGIYDENNNDLLGKVKNLKAVYSDCYFDENDICSFFTLMSYSEFSMVTLFKEFNAWLNKFPDKKIKNLAINKFSNSIKNKYKNEIIIKVKSN